MAAPVATLTLGGTDISAYVSEDKGPVIRWGRGASFDGSTEAPGYLRAIVQNPDRRFTPTNGSSPIIAQLRFNKKVRLTAVHSAVTYYLFDGFLRSIELRDDGFAELVCQDALFFVERKEAYVPLSFSRTVRQFREALLADIGITTLDLAAGNGGESMIGYSASEGKHVATLLAELNRATGTVHYIDPTSTGYNYKTLDRLTFESAASVEDWLDTDLSQPFASELGATEYADERLINRQRVKAYPRETPFTDKELWKQNRIFVAASTTKTKWCDLSEIASNLSLNYELVSGSPSITLTAYGETAKLEIAAGGTAVEIRDVKIQGKAHPVDSKSSVISEDPTSISTYGRHEGELIDSRYIPTEEDADGLADYIVWRNKDAELVPAPRFINRFPTQLARDIGDVVRITSAELGETLGRYVIRAFETSIAEKGAEWETRYSLESLPPALNLFTVGGTADQGVGGTGVLGY